MASLIETLNGPALWKSENVTILPHGRCQNNFQVTRPLRVGDATHDHKCKENLETASFHENKALLHLSGRFRRACSRCTGIPKRFLYRDASKHLLASGPFASPRFAYAFGLPRFLRIESPRISMRWALCTSRSRMPSASVGSPICSCHRETGSCEVRIVERT